jgi:hypothetical protein
LIVGEDEARLAAYFAAGGLADAAGDRLEP